MTSADWGLLVPVIIAVLTAAAAWFKSRSAHARITKVEKRQTETQAVAAHAIDRVGQVEDKQAGTALPGIPPR